MNERSDRRTIWRAFALLALAGGCGSDAHEGVPGAGGDSKYALERSEGEVEVTPIYRTCESDSDCTLVGTSCDGCCGRDAIFQSLREEYGDAYEAACSGYQGPVCDCDFKPLKAACVENSCVALPDESPRPDDGDGSDGDAETCDQVNAAIEAETARLRACEVNADCGKQLPTIGSCGCTRNLVGRLDADTSALEALHTERAELSEVPACEPAGGTCDCPVVGGVACVSGLCEWLPVNQDDPCYGLDGAYRSTEQLECGLGPDGVVLCNWTLGFGDGSFTWNHSDVGETGTYACAGGEITASTVGGSIYKGSVASDGSLVFEGVGYTR